MGVEPPMRAVAALAVLLTVAGASAARPGDRIVRQILALREPEWSSAKASDPGWITEYFAARKSYVAKRNELIWKLYKSDPGHPKTVPLLERRWQDFEAGNVGDYRQYLRRVLGDIDRVLDSKPIPSIVACARFVRAITSVRLAVAQSQNPLPAIDAYFAKAVKGPRGETLLLEASRIVGPDAKRPLLYRLITKYPRSRQAAWAKSAIHDLTSVGQPVNFEFVDAVSGRKVASSDLRGKVVVLTFGTAATWPAVLPALKEIQEELGPKGVEIVGISLDDAKLGAAGVKDFASRNGIPWPIFYQGKGLDSDFSAGWGVFQTPAVLLVDKKGLLHDREPSELRPEIERLLGD